MASEWAAHICQYELCSHVVAFPMFFTPSSRLLPHAIAPLTHHIIHRASLYERSNKNVPLTYECSQELSRINGFLASRIYSIRTPY